MRSTVDISEIADTPLVVGKVFEVATVGWESAAATVGKWESEVDWEVEFAAVGWESEAAAVGEWESEVAMVGK